jgi:hypothetical protein
VLYRFREDVCKLGGGDGIVATLTFGPYRLHVRTTPEAPGGKGKKK